MSREGPLKTHGLLLALLLTGVVEAGVTLRYEGRLRAGARLDVVTAHFEVWARRQRVGAAPAKSGTLRGVKLILHPAGRGVPLLFDAKGRFAGSVVTVNVGPGYHEAVVKVLDDLKARFAPDMKVRDTSGYWRSRRRADVERPMVGETKDILRRALKRWPDNPLVRLQTAMAGFDRVSVERWLRDLEAGRDLDGRFIWWGPGKNGGYWTNLGCVLYRLRLMGGRRPRNAATLRRAVTRDFERGRRLGCQTWVSLYYEGLMAADSGPPDRVVGKYRKALALNPDQPDALDALGKALLWAGKPGEAARSFEALARVAPGLPEAWFRLGLARCAAGERADALKALDRALKLNPRLAPAWAERGVALRESGRNAEALDSLDRALKLNRKDANTWYNRGVTLSRMGRPTAAVACLKQCLDLDRGHYDAWIALGVEELARNRTDDALRAFRRATRVAPKRWEAFHNLGLLCRHLGREGQARRALDEAKRLGWKPDGLTHPRGRTPESRTAPDAARP